MWEELGITKKLAFGVTCVWRERDGGNRRGWSACYAGVGVDDDAIEYREMPVSKSRQVVKSVKNR